MSEDEKGKQFLLLIEKQNEIQCKILQKLSSLIDANWNSSELQQDLELLMEDHKKISTQLNSLDNQNGLL